ncbi:tetratricopeptide repeat protein 4-like [Glandiceps talaboti]
MAAPSKREEAQELAKRLDEDLDDYVANLPKKKYEDGFTEENWEEEIEKVPALMTRMPTEEEIATNPALQALQAIKFDDDAPPGEKAESHKDEGNYFFKKKQYRKAVIAYTEGIKLKFDDVKLKAILFTNRAAAQYHLGNYRSSLNDVIETKKIKPDHLKALVRGAECCMHLSLYADAMNWCDLGLQISPTEKKLLDIRAKADKEKRAAERDKRKQKAKEKKEKARSDALLAAIKEKKIQLAPLEKNEDNSDDENQTRDILSMSMLESTTPAGHKVYMDDNGLLHWPVMFMYPEYGQTDIIADFNEHAQFIDHLNVMFGGDQMVSWDEERKYKPGRVEIYFEEMDKQILHKVPLDATLASILSNSRYVVVAGTPHFIVLVANSSFQQEYLKKYSLA